MAVAVPAPDPAAHRAALLFERHYGAVFGYCVWRLRTHVDAEEAAQTTFARALGALRRGHRPRNERAWLVTIARNVCTTLGTAPHRALEVAGDVPHGVLPEVDEGLAPELEAALAALPEGQRRALLLREWHELSYREIAAELGVSVGTVESWIFRARRSLASTLGSARQQLGLAGVFRWLGPSAGAKVAATAALATAVVATEQAVVTHRSDSPARPRPTQERIAHQTVASKEVSRAASVAPERSLRRAMHRVDARSPGGTERPAIDSAPKTPRAHSSADAGKPSPSTAEAQPGSAFPAVPVEQPSAPSVEAPSLPSLEPPPVEPPPVPPVEAPSLPVAAPELPPAPEVTAPALPVDVPELPQAGDVPVAPPTLP